MLNEERIILMTHMASYEKGEGKKNVKIGSYFRSDYIAVAVIKAVISASVAFAIVFALYIFYDFETFMENLYEIDLVAFAKNALTYYGITVVGYGVIAYVLSTYRHAKAMKSLRSYYHNLKKLNSLYDQQ